MNENKENDEDLVIDIASNVEMEGGGCPHELAAVSSRLFRGAASNEARGARVTDREGRLIRWVEQVFDIGHSLDELHGG